MASRVIFKYEVPIKDEFEITLPYGANICLFASQEPDPRTPKLWIEHSGTGSSCGDVVRSFRLFGTGHSIPDNPYLAHVGSVICEPFVWHLYEDLSAIKVVE